MKRQQQQGANDKVVLIDDWLAKALDVRRFIDSLRSSSSAVKAKAFFDSLALLDWAPQYDVTLPNVRKHLVYALAIYLQLVRSISDASSSSSLLSGYQQKFDALSAFVIEQCNEDIFSRQRESELFRKTDFAQEYHAVTMVAGKQLYAEAGHFVLELIQNADDTRYFPGLLSDSISKHLHLLPSLAVPRLCFSFEADQIVVQTNECGFNSFNFKSLCAVGMSSKKAKRSEDGLIGEKGIGFKSVFTVSSVVHVRSNGYSFEFDSTRQLGCSVPESVPNADVYVGTTYLLKLDNSAPARKYEDFCPNLCTLLFLHRLREMEFQFAGPKGILLSRKNEGQMITLNRVETGSLLNQSTTRQFRLDHYKCDMSQVPITRDSVRTANSSIIDLAFEIDANGDATYISDINIYAYLPIKTFRSIFNFIVNADFLLTANREDIQELAWNTTLRDAIPAAFMQAYREVFCNNERLRKSFYGFLNPTPPQSPFFGNTAQRIVELLGREDCVLSKDGLWVQPKHALLLTSTHRKAGDIFSQDIMARVFGKTFVSASIEKYSPILKKLGVVVFSDDHLTTLLGSDIFQQHLLNNHDIAEQLYSYIRSLSKNTQLFQSYPLLICQQPSSGRLALRPANSAIYWSLGEVENYNYSFLCNLWYLHDPISPTPGSNLYTFLSSNGLVMSSAPFHLLYNIVKKGHSTHHQDIVRYFYDNKNRLQSSDINKIAQYMLLLDQNGRLKEPSKLYLSRTYADDTLERVFPSASFVSGSYKETNRDDNSCWQALFKAIGVARWPMPNDTAQLLAYSIGDAVTFVDKNMANWARYDAKSFYSAITQLQGAAIPDKWGRYRRANEYYDRSATALNEFGDMLPFFPFSISADLARQLNLRYGVNHETWLEHLDAVVQSRISDVEVFKKIFRGITRHMSQRNRENIRQQFAANNWVYLPDPTNNAATPVYHKLTDTVWSVPPALKSTIRSALDSTYAEFRDFFTSLNVKPLPDIGLCFFALRDAVSKKSKDTAYIQQLYESLYQYIDVVDSALEEIKSFFSSGPMIITQVEPWTSYQLLQVWLDHDENLNNVPGISEHRALCRAYKLSTKDVLYRFFSRLGVSTKPPANLLIPALHSPDIPMAQRQWLYKALAQEIEAEASNSTKRQNIINELKKISPIPGQTCVWWQQDAVLNEFGQSAVLHKCYDKTFRKLFVETLKFPLNPSPAGLVGFLKRGLDDTETVRRNGIIYGLLNRYVTKDVFLAEISNTTVLWTCTDDFVANSAKTPVYYNDDMELFDIFRAAGGVHLLATDFNETCKFSQLLKLLGVRPLSACVSKICAKVGESKEQANTTPQAQNLVLALANMVRHYNLAEFENNREAYIQLRNSLNCKRVDNLLVTYNLFTDSTKQRQALRVERQANAAIQNNIVYVSGDKPEDWLEHIGWELLEARAPAALRSQLKPLMMIAAAWCWSPDALREKFNKLRIPFPDLD